jgi:hypothetical protein
LIFFARIAEALAIAVLGALVSRWMERRPRLTVFYGHIGEFQLQPSGVFAGGVGIVCGKSKLSSHPTWTPFRGISGASMRQAK